VVTDYDDLEDNFFENYYGQNWSKQDERRNSNSNGPLRVEVSRDSISESKEEGIQGSSEAHEPGAADRQA